MPLKLNYSLEFASVMKLSGFGSAASKMKLNTQLKLNRLLYSAKVRKE